MCILFRCGQNTCNFKIHSTNRKSPANRILVRKILFSHLLGDYDTEWTCQGALGVSRTQGEIKQVKYVLIDECHTIFEEEMRRFPYGHPLRAPNQTIEPDRIDHFGIVLGQDRSQGIRCDSNSTCFPRCCDLLGHPENSVGAFMLLVIAQLIQHIYGTQNAAGHSCRQTQQTEQGNGLAAHEVAHCNLEIISNHLVTITSGGFWEPSLFISPNVGGSSACYSYLNASTGLALAASHVWPLTVASATVSTPRPASTNQPNPMSMR